VVIKWQAVISYETEAYKALSRIERRRGEDVIERIAELLGLEPESIEQGKKDAIQEILSADRQPFFDAIRDTVEESITGILGNTYQSLPAAKSINIALTGEAPKEIVAEVIDNENDPGIAIRGDESQHKLLLSILSFSKGQAINVTHLKAKSRMFRGMSAKEIKLLFYRLADMRLGEVIKDGRLMRFKSFNGGKD
jgi:hypothetical protein